MRRLVSCGLILLLLLVPNLAAAKEDSIAADMPYLAAALAEVTASCPTTVTLPSGATVSCRVRQSRVFLPQAQVWRQMERTVDYRNVLGMTVITHTAIQRWLEDTATGEVLLLPGVEQHFWSFLYQLVDSGRSQTATEDGRHFISTSWGRFGICLGGYCGNTVQTTITLTH